MQLFVRGIEQPGNMCRQVAISLSLCALAALLNVAESATSSIHTVVSVECTDDIYFEWQVIGLAYR